MVYLCIPLLPKYTSLMIYIFTPWFNFCTYFGLDKHYHHCRNPSLGLATKARGLQGCGPSGSPGVTPHAPGGAREWGGVNPRTPKGVQLWELESRWTPESSKDNFKGQNSMIGGVFYTVGKLSMRATTLLQTASQSKVSSQSYGAPKSRESQLRRFRDSHLGVPGQKVHLDVGPVEKRRVYYKVEGGGFPQVRAVVSIVCPCCPWLVLAPKMF